ncbi:Zinc finger BED domain-containing protein RICESLEEPER 3 [Bienertia sinuspersici]
MEGSANSPTIVVDEDDDALSNTQGQATNSQGRMLTSFVWTHMERKVLPDESIQDTCNHCKSNYCASSNSGTSHLQRHIDKCPKRIRSIFKHFRYSIPKNKKFYSIAKTSFGITNTKSYVEIIA